MRYAESLQAMFPRLDPVVDDLFLLEDHQIDGLPDRAPARELAAVLHADPRLHRFLVTRHPPIRGYVAEVMTEHGPAAAGDLTACRRALAWELADLIAYQRAPELYDAGVQIDWDIAAVTQRVDLDGKVVVDGGAGTGRVSLAAARVARHVYAVEPVATLRRYLRHKAARAALDNLFTLDGFLHAIPLPTGSVDVLLTCQAIGWRLGEELLEIERILRPGGTAMHMFGSAAAASVAASPLHDDLLASGYQPASYQRGSVQLLGYARQYR